MKQKPIYLSQLPYHAISLAQVNHAIRLSTDGFYTPEEINYHVQSLPDQKIVDLEDTIDREIYKQLRELQENYIQTYYLRYDLQDRTDYAYCTLEQAKDWLIQFWNEHPDDDMTDEEHDTWIETIEETTDWEILSEYLSGIDYTLEELI